MKRLIIYILLASAAIGCHIEMPLKPVAKFRFTPENGCQAPCNVIFTTESENAVSTQWDFNDGSPLRTSSGDTVHHTFTSGKIYEVKLIVKGVDGGSSGETRSVKIDAAAATVPEADFKYTITNDSIAPATVTFNNQSKNAVSYSWDFGDPNSASNTSTLQNPLHTYSAPGSYVVTLTATNEQNVTDTQSYTIVIKAPESNNDAISISGLNNFTTDIIVDNNGNVYVCGVAAGTVKFSNSISLSTSGGSTDAFVAKYNSNLQCEWAKLIGSNSEDHANGIALNANNDVFVTGYLDGELSGGGTTPKGDFDGFVAKFDGPSGERRWIKTFGGPGQDRGRSIVYSPKNDKIYLTGYVAGNTQTSTIDFGGILWHADGTDGFFVPMNPSNGDFGTPIIFGGGNSQQPEDMAVDSDGNAYISGGFLGSISFPSIAQPISAEGDFDIFVAKWAINSSSFQWVKGVGSTEADYPYDVVVDASKNVFMTGMHKGKLEKLNLASSAFENVFLGKWNANGEVQTGKNGFNELKPDYHGGIALTNNGNIIIAGTFENNGRFPMTTGNLVVGDPNSRDILITEADAAQLNNTGQFVKTGGGSGDDRVNRICVALGNVYATGWFEGNATFNGVQLKGAASVKNTFIVRYKQ